MSRNKYKNNESLNEKVRQSSGVEGSDDSLSEYDQRMEASEQDAISHERQQRAAEPSRERDGVQRVDVWDNAQALGTSSVNLNRSDHSSDGGIGEFKDTLSGGGVPRNKITETVDPESGPSQVGAKVPAKGFPWWWILLPLIIIGLIWGLTRKPVDNTENPDSTSTQGSRQIMVAEQADYFKELNLL